MASTPVFPNDPYLLIRLPAFRHEVARRVALSVEIPTDADTANIQGGFAPLAAIQVDPKAAVEYTRDLVCKLTEYEQQMVAADGNKYIEGDTTSRITFGLSTLSAIGTPNGSLVSPSPSEPAPLLEFQIRASIANTPGDIRWGGIVGAPGKTYLGCAGFVGKTGGILATRWEIWGRVVQIGSTNWSPVQATILMIIDRVGDANENVYGNDVTPVP